jgi:hypothetical protein
MFSAVPRTTADAGVIAFLSVDEAESLIDEARAADFQLDPQAEKESLQTAGTFSPAMPPFHLDIILASLPFEEAAFQRATIRSIFGLRLRFPCPEDLIALKVLAGRRRDLLDAEGVARRHAATLDRTRLEETIRPLCDPAEDTTPWERRQDILLRWDPRGLSD